MPGRMVEKLESRTLCATGPAPVAWFRAVSIAAPDGVAVDLWRDLSGNGYHATQPDAARRPHLDADSLNGRAAVHFDAASSTQLTFPRPVTGDFTLVVVFDSEQGLGKSESWFNGAGLVDAEVPGVRSDFGVSLNSLGQVLAGTGGPDTFVSSGLGFDDGRAHVATFTRTAATGQMSLHVDGRLFGRATGGTRPLSASARLTIGSLQTNTNYFTGDIGEVRVYGAALPDDTRAAVEGELAASFNVAPPPANWFANPVLNRDFPDPGVVYAGGSYYAYATNGNGANVQMARSSNLVNWTTLYDALPALPSWAQAGRTWAPDVAVTAGGTYNLYYTAWSRTSGRQAIGVATASSPAGPFTPVGTAPLVSQSSQGGAIDPSVFTDSAGVQYLLWKNDGNAVGQDTWIYLQRLAADGRGLVGSPVQLIRQDQAWEGSLVEGPVLWARDGRYYLFYSANNYANGSYATGYAVADSLLGPYVKPGAPLLATTSEVIGPGGPEVAVGPDGNTWMLYHSWEGGTAYRSLSVDRIEWEGDVPVIRGPSRDLQPVPVPATVHGRHVFYNNSAYDGFDPGASARDDGAIAPDKQALRPGQRATFANVTSYTRGINGVMVDVSVLPQSLWALRPAAFGIEVGTGAGWSAGPAPTGLTVRRGAGVNGSDRITLTWPDGAVRNKWLRVTVPTTAATGLAAPDVFAFGNLIGEIGDAVTDTARVTAVDIFAVRRLTRSGAAGITTAFDFNRDGRVDVLDTFAARSQQSRNLAMVIL